MEKKLSILLFLLCNTFAESCLAVLTSCEISFPEKVLLCKDTNNNAKDSLIFRKNKEQITLTNQKQGFFLKNQFKLGFRQKDKDLRLVERVFFISPGNLEMDAEYYQIYKKSPFDLIGCSYQDLHLFINKLIEKAENNGFPFAEVQLDSLRKLDGKYFAQINLKKGPFISFDSLKITGDSRVKLDFLSKYIGIVNGEPFSQEKINIGLEKIKSLPYFNWVGDPDLSFQNEEATLYLPIDDRNINQIDGFLVLVPNRVKAGKYMLTGIVDLSLRNMGGRGRDFKLNWQRPDFSSQNLRLEVFEPLFLGSKINAGFDFFLFKQDSAFLNQSYQLNFDYPAYKFKISFFTGLRNSGILGLNNLNFDKKIDYISNKFQYLGLKGDFKNFDHLFLSKRSFECHLALGLGNKKVLPSVDYYIVDFEQIQLNSFQTFIEGEIQKIEPIKEKIILAGDLKFGVLRGNKIFKNEFYRLGGIKSIRGFNENYFFVNNYIFFNVEPRFYFDTDSYFLIFVGGGRLQNLKNIKTVDLPISAGIGLKFDTNGGDFSFIWAQGSSNEQKFSIQHSRIHIGYSGRF